MTADRREFRIYPAPSNRHIPVPSMKLTASPLTSIVSAIEVRHLLGLPSYAEHPIIESERQRHLAWGHNVVDITRFDSDYCEYLCSCGIYLTADRYGRP